MSTPAHTMASDALAPEPESATTRVRRLLTSALRDPASIATLAPRDLDLTLRLLRRANLLGRIGWQLRESGFPSSLPRVAVDQLLSALVHAEAQQRTALWELDRVTWALRSAPPAQLVVLKGCAYVLAGLPNARGRAFADVDLLVPRAELEAVESCLRERGWRTAEVSPHDDRYYRRWAHELPPMQHVERSTEVDLHHNIVMSTARLRPSAKLLLEQSRHLPGSPLQVLAPVDMVLHSMTHLMFNSDLVDALRELVDIDDLLRHFAEHESDFWTRFWQRAEELDLARPAWYALRHARRWLDTPAPAAVFDASRAGAPPTPIVQLTDRLIPQALFPLHPDAPSRSAHLARWLLYVRSHWIRMPAPMLARHLGHKFYVRYRAAKSGAR